LRLLDHRPGVLDADLAVPIVANGQDLTVVGQEKRVVATGRTGHDAITVQGLDQSGTPLVLEVAKTELAFLVSAPGINFALIGHRKLVGCRGAGGHRLELYVDQSGQADRRPDGVWAPGKGGGLPADVIPVGGSCEEQYTGGQFLDQEKIIKNHKKCHRHGNSGAEICNEAVTHAFGLFGLANSVAVMTIAIIIT
jgi:hypothetical protein